VKNDSGMVQLLTPIEKGSACTFFLNLICCLPACLRAMRAEKSGLKVYKINNPVYFLKDPLLLGRDDDEDTLM